MECVECSNFEKVFSEMQKNYDDARSKGGSYAVGAEAHFPQELQRLRSELAAHQNSPFCKRKTK